MTNPNTPILIGAGLTVQKERDPAKAKSPVDLLAEAAQLAFGDTGNVGIAQAVDTVASIRFITDSPEARDFPCGIYLNPAHTVSELLGLAPPNMMLAATGGNSPQMMINELAERIANGTVETALLVGGEGFASVTRALAQGLDMSHGTTGPTRKPKLSGLKSLVCCRSSTSTACFFRSTAIRYLKTHCARIGARYGTHMEKVGKLMAPFTTIAAASAKLVPDRAQCRRACQRNG